MKEIVLFTIPLPQLQALIIDSVNACLDVRKKDTPEPPQQDEILDIKDAAAFIKLSIPSMYRLCNNNEIPNFKKGKKILFSKQELTNWAKTGRRKTLKEMAEMADIFLEDGKKVAN